LSDIAVGAAAFAAEFMLEVLRAVLDLPVPPVGLRFEAFDARLVETFTFVEPPHPAASNDAAANAAASNVVAFILFSSKTLS
jgi:hypothetical protein